MDRIGTTVSDEAGLDALLQQHGNGGARAPDAARTRAALAAAVPVDLDHLDLPDKIRELIENGWEGNSGYASRSEADAAVVTSLLGAHASDGNVRWVFENYPIGEKFREKERSGPAYLCHTIGKMQQHLEQNLQKRRGRKAPAHVVEAGESEKDYGHAQVLAGLFRDRFRWAVHRKSWMEFGRGVWRPAPEERVAKKASDELRAHYAAALTETRDKHIIQAVAKLTRETCVYARIMGALSFLRGWDSILTLPEEWDADPWLFNAANGTLNLRDISLQRHDPKDMLTQTSPVDFDPQAAGPCWAAHVERFLPNPNVRRQVQRDMGQSMVGATLQEILPVWFGLGRNGKSTTANVVMRVFGDYAIRAAPNLLVQKKFEAHPTELADLAGRRLVVSVEVDANNRLSEALVKDLTGGDRKKARYMRGDFFEFEQTFSIVLIVNHRPVILGTDEGIWRRIRLVPWEQQIEREAVRPQDEVVTELAAEGSAILNWMLSGLADWQRDHHWLAPEVSAATENYRAEQDALGVFLGENCDLGRRYAVPVKDLYEAYTEHAEQAGEDPLKRGTFNRLLKQRGVFQARKAGTGDRQWSGIRLKQGCDKL